LLEGAKTIVAGALCYYRDAPAPSPGEGRLPRYTWRDEYAALRTRLDALGRRLGGAYRVLVDENDHVDRAAAVRAGVAFYGKNTMAITRRHGSWVVLGVVVTDVEVEPSPPLELDCGECRLCIDACPTGALDEPGTLDSTKCLSYWTQAPAPIPEEYRPELGGMVYGCDICQEVCPWNRGVEKRRRAEQRSSGPDGRVSLADWLARDGRDLVAEFDRLYVPRNDPRWLRRNALVAAGNVGAAALAPAVGRYANDPDPVLSDAASWALAGIADRNA
jgi:epoxyqueuosine reductase